MSERDEFGRAEPLLASPRAAASIEATELLQQFSSLTSGMHGLRSVGDSVLPGITLVAADVDPSSDRRSDLEERAVQQPGFGFSRIVGPTVTEKFSLNTDEQRRADGVCSILRGSKGMLDSGQMDEITRLLAPMVQSLAQNSGEEGKTRWDHRAVRHLSDRLSRIGYGLRLDLSGPGFSIVNERSRSRVIEPGQNYEGEVLTIRVQSPLNRSAP
jgi:hypothetical protein